MLIGGSTKRRPPRWYSNSNPKSNSKSPREELPSLRFRGSTNRLTSSSNSSSLWLRWRYGLMWLLLAVAMLMLEVSLMQHVSVSTTPSTSMSMSMSTSTSTPDTTPQRPRSAVQKDAMMISLTSSNIQQEDSINRQGHSHSHSHSHLPGHKEKDEELQDERATTRTTTKTTPTLTLTPTPTTKTKTTTRTILDEDWLLYNRPLDVRADLPAWMADYVEWHADMRRQFPGMDLFTHPDAPPLLVRTCLGLCGGLHDRLGQLPWDMYLAQATHRVLLLAWQRPRGLEHFLIPNHPTLFDWSIPVEAKFGFDDIKTVRNHTNLFQEYPDDHPTEDFWKFDVDAALTRATTGEYRHNKILRHRLLGHLGETALQDRLAKEGFHEDVHVAPYFGRLFWLFFRPSPAVHKSMTHLLQTKLLLGDGESIGDGESLVGGVGDGVGVGDGDGDGGISSNTSNAVRSTHTQVSPPPSYTAVHCRVRHPKATQYGTHVLGKNPKYPADKTGLPWEGDTRQFALDVATQALQCAKSLVVVHPPIQSSSTPDQLPQSQSQSQSQSTQQRVYFMSDSNDLVRHVVVELQDPQFVQANRTLLDVQLYNLVVTAPPPDGATATTTATAAAATVDSPPPPAIATSPIAIPWIIARDNWDQETAHIDRQKGRPPEAYLDTFVDLLVGIHAECVVYGIGYYAAFGAKISGTPCAYVYQQEAWGQGGGGGGAFLKLQEQTHVCPSPSSGTATTTTTTTTMTTMTMTTKNTTTTAGP